LYDAEQRGEVRGIAIGAEKLAALLESGKTLEEARKLLGL